MFLKKTKNNKTGRTYLSVVESYRDKETGRSKRRTVKSFGYYDELEKNILTLSNIVIMRL